MNAGDQRLDWFRQYAEGSADAETIRQLDAALREDGQLRGLFIEYLNIDLALALDSPVETLSVTRVPQRRPLLAVLAAAAVVVAAATTFYWRAASVPVVSPSAWATLVAARDAVWSDPNVELLLQGGEIPAGEIRIDSGVAEFMLRDGAAVVLRGPAAMRFLGAKRIFLEAGRLGCRCPTPESRVTVETPVTEVIDLGTEFAIEARPDRSARVAVLSGEVQVGRGEARHLRQGEAVEVRSDGMLIVRGFSQDEFADLQQTTRTPGAALLLGENQLRDPGFDHGLNTGAWDGTESNLAATSAGRNGNAIRISARGPAPWPQCRQKLSTGDLSGKLLVASVWAASTADEPLRPPQFGILKLAFVNEHGREFAFAKRHLLASPAAPGRFESVQLAVVAPPGTCGLQFQLILHAHTYGRGAVVFDDASLSIGDVPRSPDEPNSP
jgi:hypothetical protein